MSKYVRVTRGHYKGKIGVVSQDEESIIDTHVIIMFAVPLTYSSGVSLPPTHFEEVDRKYYFKDKLCGTL